MISDVGIVLSKCSSLPKIVIFDLDKTIWDVYAAEQTFPPYRRVSTNEVIDSVGNTVRSYRDVPAIMQALHARGILIALASLSPSFDKCDALLSALDLKQYISRDLVQIRQESSKLPHFRQIQIASKVHLRYREKRPKTADKRADCRSPSTTCSSSTTCSPTYGWRAGSASQPPTSRKRACAAPSSSAASAASTTAAAPRPSSDGGSPGPRPGATPRRRPRRAPKERREVAAGPRQTTATARRRSGGGCDADNGRENLQCLPLRL